MSGKVVGMAFECEAKLSATERYVLVAFADNADTHGKCWPDPKTIIDKTGLGRSSVYRAKDRLTELGLFSEGEDESGRRCFWLHLSHSGTDRATGPDSEMGRSQSRSGTGVDPTQGKPIPPGDSDSHSGTPYIDEPSGTVTEPIHTQRARIDLPDGVLEAVAEVAALKRHPTPPAEQLAKITADFPDRDIPVEAERFRRYYLAGKGRARSMGDPAEAWRRWLAGADPIPTPRHLRPVPEARAFGEAAAAAGREKWAAALVDLRPQIAAAAFEARIEPIEPLGFEDGTLFVRAPEEARSWLERRYSSLIEATTDCKLELAA